MLVVHGITQPLGVQVLPGHHSYSYTSKLIYTMLIVLPQLGRIFTVQIINKLLPITSNTFTLMGALPHLL
jgi:hypothetical protein